MLELAGWLDGEEEAGATGKGVLRVGAPSENGWVLANPVLGQMSKRVVKLKKTLDALTIPGEMRSVLLAPEPLFIHRYE